jgi:hypothetical protein
MKCQSVGPRWTAEFLGFFHRQAFLRARRVRPQVDTFEVEVEINLRPTVSRPVSLGVRHPSGTRDQFFFLLEISFTQLRVCNFVAPSLTRGRVCNLLVQLLLGLARAVTLGSKYHRTQGRILLSHGWAFLQLGSLRREPAADSCYHVRAFACFLQ